MYTHVCYDNLQLGLETASSGDMAKTAWFNCMFQTSPRKCFMCIISMEIINAQQWSQYTTDQNAKILEFC